MMAKDLSEKFSLKTELNLQQKLLFISMSPVLWEYWFCEASGYFLPVLTLFMIVAFVGNATHSLVISHPFLPHFITHLKQEFDLHFIYVFISGYTVISSLYKSKFVHILIGYSKARGFAVTYPYPYPYPYPYHILIFWN